MCVTGKRSCFFPVLFRRSELLEREGAYVLFFSGILRQWKQKLLLFSSVLFCSVQAFWAIRKRSLFCSVLFRRSAQVEMEAASALFRGDQ
jgi:hypothetical protein